MKRLFTFFLLIFLSSSANFAQIQSVNFDVVTNQINEGNPIPSEEPFYIRGTLPHGIEYVKVYVYRSGKSPNQGDEYFWKTAFDFEVSQYEIFVSSPLRSGENYNLDFHFYQRADEDQMENITDAISNNLESYIQSNFEVAAGGIRSFRSEQVMMTQMNQIVRDALEDYRHFLGRDFPGFSDVVRQKLEQRNKLKLRRARFNILGRNRGDNERAVYAQQFLDELTTLVTNEADQFLHRSQMSLVDIRKVSSYPTENKPSTLPLNFGYGAFALKRSLPNTEYFNGPYVGLSLPLGNKTFQRVLGNASISTGVFIQNFTSSQGDKISGPLINLPIYAGLGYKLFRVMRFNAGIVVINFEEPDLNVNTNYIQPFVGLSLEFNLWLGINDRR